MKAKKNWIVLIVVLLIVVFGAGVYRANRFSDPFRSASDKSTSGKESTGQAEQIRGEEEKKASDTGDDAGEGSDKKSSADDSKVLVAYFSWSSSGNTEKMAKVIQEQTKGDLFEIEPANPYPTDYEECTEVAEAEKENNERPEVAGLPDSLEQYEKIYIGYPIWWHTAPMIIGTFLENYDLSGIDVYPFAQSASMDEEQFEESMDFVRNSAGKADVHDGLFAEATDTDAILSYLDQNN